jgi:hypothetical protein
MDRLTFLKMAGAAALVSGCAPRAAGPSATTGARRFGVWTGDYRTLEEWRRMLDRMQRAGINMILPSAGDDRLREVIPMARDHGIEVHAWRKIMMNAAMLKEHPEWYAVNRNGVSTATKPPYVDYYHFMCPSRLDVQEWLIANARATARLDGLASVHLDYIRFPDVILPVALWPKYNLVQDREHPEFDYCYCDVCRNAFKAQFGVDPLQLLDPTADVRWRRFRWDAITHMVGRLHDAVHAEGKRITAAVFPTPAIARALVRQDWINWKIDALMPMTYNGFYNEPVSWIGRAARDGVTALQGRVPLYTGIYVPDVKPDELGRGARDALSAGASGVVVFDAGAMSEAHWQSLSAVTHS